MNKIILDLTTCNVVLLYNNINKMHKNYLDAYNVYYNILCMSYSNTTSIFSRDLVSWVFCLIWHCYFFV